MKNKRRKEIRRIATALSALLSFALLAGTVMPVRAVTIMGYGAGTSAAGERLHLPQVMVQPQEEQQDPEQSGADSEGGAVPGDPESSGDEVISGHGAGRDDLLPGDHSEGGNELPPEEQGGDTVSDGNVSAGGIGDMPDDIPWEEPEDSPLSYLLPAGMVALSTGQRLTAAELDALNDALSDDDNGFFQCVYSRPEEIDWCQVFYNGAGIGEKADDEIFDAFEDEYGELYTGLTVIDYAALEDFVWDRTETEYREARKPLWVEERGSDQWWKYLNGKLVFAHGDTNYRPVEFLSGTKDGDVYRLIYSNYINKTYAPRNYVATVRIENGDWIFLSNVPADAPVPLDLLRIEFYEDKEAAEEAAGEDIVDIVYDPELLSGNPGEANGFAVVTVLADDVTVRLDMEDVFGDSWHYALAQRNIHVPTKRLYEDTFEKGDKILVEAGLPWLATRRISAAKGEMYGEYWFGSDNWLYLFDEDGMPLDRYVTGHDAEAEGRGLHPSTKGETAQALEGDWIYFDPETEKPAAILNIHDYGSMTLELLDEHGQASETYEDLWARFMNIYTDVEDAPDTLSLSIYNDAMYAKLPLPKNVSLKSTALGDYFWFGTQEEDFQELTLVQANNGEGVLSYVLGDGRDEREFTFTFRRYTGVRTWKSAYKDKLVRTLHDGALSADYGNTEDMFVQWRLYDIDKNGVPELFLLKGEQMNERTVEIYTIGGNGAPEQCFFEGEEDSPIDALYMYYYSIPKENGVVLWTNYKNSSSVMRKVTLDGTVLSEELIHEESLYVNNEEAEPASPSEIIPGSGPLSWFLPDVLLPVDDYEMWASQSGDLDVTELEGDSANPFVWWRIRSMGYPDEAAHVDEDRLNELLNAGPENMILVQTVPEDKYLNHPGEIAFTWLFNGGVISENSGDLYVRKTAQADFNGDGVNEAVLYLGIEDFEYDISMFRLVISETDNQIYVFIRSDSGDVSLNENGIFLDSMGWRKGMLIRDNQTFMYYVP